MSMTSPRRRSVVYVVKTKTADRYCAGTDNNIEIFLWGMKGEFQEDPRVLARKDRVADLLASGWHRIHGSQERNKTDYTEITTDDIGHVYGISLKLTTRLLDAWIPDYIWVFRDNDKKSVEAGALQKNGGGWSQFRIAKEIKPYGGTYHFFSTDWAPPEVSVSAEGDPVPGTDVYIVTDFADNPHPTESQQVMRHLETWEGVDEIRISTSKAESVTTEGSVEYTSPASEIYGGFKVGARAGWERVVNDGREDAIQHKEGSAFDWTCTAPPGCAVFRRQHFRIPHSSQLFRQEDGVDARIVRKLNGKITPSGMSVFLYIPDTKDGVITPVAKEELESNFMQYLDPDVAQTVREEFFEDWERDGYLK